MTNAEFKDIHALFAWTITFRVMGRDFEAAVMSAGHVGFGLGITPNAVANMNSLVEDFGSAPPRLFGGADCRRVPY